MFEWLIQFCLILEYSHDIRLKADTKFQLIKMYDNNKLYTVQIEEVLLVVIDQSIT